MFQNGNSNHTLRDIRQCSGEKCLPPLKSAECETTYNPDPAGSVPERSVSCRCYLLGKDGNDYETILYSGIRNGRTPG